MLCRRAKNVLYPDHWLHRTALEKKLMPPRASLDAPLPDDDGLDIPTFAFHPVRAASLPDDARLKASASPTPLPARRPLLLSAALFAGELLMMTLALWCVARVIGGLSLWGGA